MPSAKKRARKKDPDPVQEVIDQFVNTVMENPTVQDTIDVVFEFRDFFRQTQNAIDPSEDYDETVHHASRSKKAKRRRPPPPPRQPPPPPKEDLSNKARYTLHFGPTEALTKASIQKRRKELAAFCHPDRGGSTEAMQAVNSAADYLIKQL